MTTSIRSRDLIQPVFSGRVDHSRLAACPEQAEWQAADGTAVKLGLLTRTAFVSAWMILGFLVYALNLQSTAGSRCSRSGRGVHPDDPSAVPAGLSEVSNPNRGARTLTPDPAAASRNLPQARFDLRSRPLTPMCRSAELDPYSIEE